MTYHIWGDGFDFDRLGEAERFIWDECQKVGLTICTKEKYGTIRYEGLWEIDSKEKYQMLDGIIEKAAKEFPEVAPEILDDWNDLKDCYECYR